MYKEIKYNIIYRVSDTEYLKVQAKSILNLDGDIKAIGTDESEHKIDWDRAFLSESTGMFDMLGNKIFHGDIVRNEETNKVYEIMYSCGAFFILEDDERILLEESLVMKMTLIGDSLNNPELLLTEEQLNKLKESIKKQNEEN